ncbi:MAG TPA: S49 family peptidase, partial [Pirellulales bacterium]|nr:S49 family peptidase [Pirellulales bacterium]
VKSGRPKMTEAQIKEVATGQVFSTKQALDKGLIDKVGFLDDAIDRAIDLATLDKAKTRVVKYDKSPGFVESLLGATSEAQRGAGVNLAAVLDLSAPRAYFLCTWLPALLSNQH